MPTSGVDRMFLAACFWLMALSLRLFRLAQRLNQESA